MARESTTSISTSELLISSTTPRPLRMILEMALVPIPAARVVETAAGNLRCQLWPIRSLKPIKFKLAKTRTVAPTSLQLHQAAPAHPTTCQLGSRLVQSSLGPTILASFLTESDVLSTRSWFSPRNISNWLWSLRTNWSLLLLRLLLKLRLLRAPALVIKPMVIAITRIMRITITLLLPTPLALFPLEGTGLLWAESITPCICTCHICHSHRSHSSKSVSLSVQVSRPLPLP